MKRHGFLATGLHGDMTQSARLAALNEFKNGQITLLIASDVAARGLDIPSVSHVFNFDVPSNAEDYVHRIGRTGRAGRLGFAFTLVAGEDDEKAILAIEKLTGQPIPIFLNADEQSKTESSSNPTGKLGKKQRKNRTTGKSISNKTGLEQKNLMSLAIPLLDELNRGKTSSSLERKQF